MYMIIRARVVLFRVDFDKGYNDDDHYIWFIYTNYGVPEIFGTIYIFWQSCR